MSNNAQQGQHRCSSMECSPTSLARRIEGCILRNAWDEEQRAQKALFLLKTRDRRIAFLEKRVAELEDIAANLHEVTLRHSSRVSTLGREKEAVSDFTRSEKSLKTNEETDERTTDCDASNIESFDKRANRDCDTSTENEVSVPCLNLSKSSASNSEKDIFSTPAIDFTLEQKDHVCISNTNQVSENVTKQQDKFMKKRVCSKSEAKLKTVNEQQISDGDEKNFMGEKDTVEHGLIIMDKAMSENNVDKKGASVSTKIKEGEDRSVSYIKQQWSNLPRTSSSVPWIRAKHSFRKKLRGYELKAGRRVEELPAGDGNPTFMIPRSIDTGSTTDQRNGKREIVDGATKTERSRVTREQNEAPNAQEARLVAVQKVDTKMKTTYTQTSAIGTTINEKTSKFNELKTNIDCGPVSYTDSERKRSSAFWNVDEDPAPQWLIEEALNRGTEHRERWRKDEATSNKETEYETIITELEAKLNETRANLEEALRTKSIVKEKYKRTLENAKAEARKENEVLQDRIVRICTSVLENFGPRTMTEKIGNSYQTKICKRSRCHGKISCKLHKKLHMAVTRSNKLKRKLATARRLLKNKSEKCESIGKCFDRLKEKMETTESNLNNLISENLALRKSIEDTRQWMEQSIEKEHHEKINSVHFRDIHRSRELTNLKKKVEESLGTISQLRNKLLRSESANANKGFLLNSYKSQLVDLNTEKKELMSKISDLENEISTVKSSNSQLKAKISVLNIEKDKLLSENEKSKTDVTEKLETKCCTKCEQLREELDSLKAKYMRTMKAMTKLDATETQNKEYSKAIKEFLKKLYEYRSNCETQKNPNESEASEREAHETACNILNMTPEELSGFINGKAPTSINSWVVEFNRIITKASFSESLSKFLFKKAIKKVKT